MQALASYIMRGRSQATLVAVAAAVLSLMMPLAGLISSATVALVTLRHGVREGLVIGLLAGVVSGLIAFAALGSPVPALGFAMALWLPVWSIAAVLRYSRSLGLASQLSVLIGLIILVGVHLQTSDPAVYWAELLEPVRVNLVDGGVVDEAGSQLLVGGISRWMTGAFAATFYFQVLIALLIGRWWQAILYNPGGFGDEFRAFRVHPALGFLGAACFMAFYLTDEVGWAAELLLLLIPVFLLQGVALVHALASTYQVRRGWLIGFYALLVVAMPHAEVLVAALGFADVWTDLRAKVRTRRDKKE